LRRTEDGGRKSPQYKNQTLDVREHWLVNNIPPNHLGRFQPKCPPSPSTCHNRRQLLSAYLPTFLPFFSSIQNDFVVRMMELPANHPFHGSSILRSHWEPIFAFSFCLWELKIKGY
jgi:hypothetical protein